MSPEQGPEAAAGNPEHEASEGEHWLKLLGREELIGKPIPYEQDGRQLKAEEFPLLCGEHVRPVIKGLESLPENDPRRQQGIRALNQVIDSYLTPSPERS